jgi:hypothetical protein
VIDTQALRDPVAPGLLADLDRRPLDPFLSATKNGMNTIIGSFIIAKGEQEHEERASSGIGVLLDSFWYKAIVGALFALFAGECII